MDESHNHNDEQNNPFSVLSSKTGKTITYSEGCQLLSRCSRRASGVLVMFYFLIWVAIKQVFLIYYSIKLCFGYFSVCILHFNAKFIIMIMMMMLSHSSFHMYLELKV